MVILALRSYYSDQWVLRGQKQLDLCQRLCMLLALDMNLVFLQHASSSVLPSGASFQAKYAAHFLASVLDHMS